ncbi:MAG: N-formylglutamate amidohydrolase [Pseudomonadota bacterium]
MPKYAFTLDTPEVQTTSLVFASPHSGADYPDTFLKSTVLDKRTIRSSEDAFVDELFSSAPEFGAPFLKAGAPRAYLDLNRSCDELDPALIEDVRKIAHNPRVASGLGVVPRVVANGRAIYRGKLPRHEARHRIEAYWRPYHEKLQSLLDATQAQFGEAVLIDCHSMPHEAIDTIARGATARPEVVLGDRFGASARSDIVDRVEAAFIRAGLRVVRNAPFAGAYIAQTYGRPSRGQHVVQIEIDRSLYMNEYAVTKSAHFEDFRAVLRSVIAELVTIGEQSLPLAAE